MGVQLRGFEADDREAVMELRRLTFEGLDQDWENRRWDWEFERNPNQRDDLPFTWLLEDGPRVVGNFGMIPVQVKIGEQTAQAYDGIDLCLHPEYQGQGLANPLADAFMDSAHGQFPFVTAPVPVTTHLLVQRGGTLIGGGTEEILWIYESGVGNAESRVPNRRVAEIRGFDESHDELWRRVSPAYPLLIVRDSRYLNWRYRDYPGGRPVLLESRDDAGVLGGFAVFQSDRAEDRAYLLELFCAPDDAETARALLLRAQERVTSEGLSRLAIVTRVPLLQAVLREVGFSAHGGELPAYVGKVNVPGAGVDAGQWYVSLGDGDGLFSVHE